MPLSARRVGAPALRLVISASSRDICRSGVQPIGQSLYVPADDLLAALARAMADGTRSWGDNLTGMQIDLYRHLEDLDEINEDSVDVQRARDAERMIRASCTAAEGVSLDEAATAVRDVWVSVLRYKYLEAHELRVGDGEATLAFVTQIGPHGLYVTGQVHVLPS